MKIVLQNRQGEILTYPGQIGQNLIGLRLNQIIFESSKEIQKLASTEGQKWLQYVVALAMKE